MIGYIWVMILRREQRKTINQFFLDIAKAFFVGGVVTNFFQPFISINSRVLVSVASIAVSMLYLALAIRILKAKRSQYG